MKKYKNLGIAVLTILILLITIGTGIYFIKYQVKKPLVPAPQKVETEPKFGIEGEVKESTLSGNLGDLYKVKVNFDEKQKEAFNKNYGGYNLSSPIQLSAQVLEISSASGTIKVSTGKNEGWIKVSPQWHGNVLKNDPKIGDYVEQKVINISKGQWPVMIGLLEQSKKVLLLCYDNLCKETIGGHIYLD